MCEEYVLLLVYTGIIRFVKKNCELWIIFIDIFDEINITF